MKPSVAAALKEHVDAPVTQRMSVRDVLELCRRHRHRAALLGALAERASEFESGDTGPARFLLVDADGRQEPFVERVVEAARIELRTLAEQARLRAKQVSDLVVDVPLVLVDVELGALNTDVDPACDTVKPNHEYRSGQR